MDMYVINMGVIKQPVGKWQRSFKQAATLVTFARFSTGCAILCIVKAPLKRKIGSPTFSLPVVDGRMVNPLRMGRRRCSGNLK